MDLTVTLVNQLGQALQTIELNAYNNHEIYLQDLAPGIYFLKAKDQILKQKIMVAQH